MKNYEEVIVLHSFIERYRYLKLQGVVGKTTFGFERYLNQRLYTSDEWRQVRNKVIVRDKACDLACEGYEIHGAALIHHMNPITQDDVLEHSGFLINPEYLITVAYMTHQAIHYGNYELINYDPVVRTAGDTKLW